MQPVWPWRHMREIAVSPKLGLEMYKSLTWKSSKKFVAKCYGVEVKSILQNNYFQKYNLLK